MVLRAKVTRIVLLGCLALASGCSLPARPVPPTALVSPRAIVDLEATPGIYEPYDPGRVQELLRSGTNIGPSNPNLPHRQVLTLSGGGMFGAYTAGVLKGWSSSGTRPQFDLVTGISTGAMIAPFAFLGSKYDDHLAHRYTQLTSQDVYKKRSIWAIPFAESLTDSAPLRELVAEEITPELLDEIAVAHGEGRRLYIGTTNLDSNRLVVWDMGAIASSRQPGRLDLFRSIVLASCAFPGMFPPVGIDVVVDGRTYRELHADGGVIASIFLDLPMLIAQSPTPTSEPETARSSDVYAIVSGKLFNEPKPAKQRLFQLAGKSLNNVLQARGEGDLARISLLSTLTGGQFRLAAVPQEMETDPNFLSFKTEEMKALYDVGYATAASNTQWRTTAPGNAWNEQRLPRTGVHFATIPVQAKSINGPEHH